MIHPTAPRPVPPLAGDPKRHRRANHHQNRRFTCQEGCKGACDRVPRPGRRSPHAGQGGREPVIGATDCEAVRRAPTCRRDGGSSPPPDVRDPAGPAGLHRQGPSGTGNGGEANIPFHFLPFLTRSPAMVDLSWPIPSRQPCPFLSGHATKPPMSPEKPMRHPSHAGLR